MLSRSLPSNLKTTSMSHAPLARTRVLPLHLLGALAALCALPARGAAGDSCDGGQASFVQNPRTVAVLETRVPEQRRFLLRGTVPLPPGVYPRTDGLNPLTILDYDGTPLLTQIEIVSQYPSPVDGADVVELLAQVRRDPTLSPGEPTQYTVIQRLNESSPSPGLIEPLPRGVLDMLADPTQVELASYDCFGNKYVAYPLMIGSAIRRLRSGPIMAEVRSFQNMLPAEPVPGSTLPHFLGVHTYRSVIRGSSHIGLDLRFHNAHDGFDHASALDDPLDKLYFERIELSMPAEWTVLQDFDDPLFGAERVVGNRRIIALVEPDPSGDLHVIRWQGQFHRRLMLTPVEPQFVDGARARLDGAGRAFCARGFVNGREYYSWWNAETARYFPQRHQLPLLDHVGRATLEGELASEFNFVVSHLRDGTGIGDYPLASGRLGWGHPYGVSYGGMTSGLEINCYDGITVAAAASPRGYRLFTALHRMQTDRQPNVLYRLDGEPSSVEQWLIENGNDDYVPFEHFVVPLLGYSQQDPFGIRSAPQFQIDFARSNGLQPAYEAAHLGFDPHDYQHFIRYTRAAKVLAWLANDSLAIDDLRMQAECFNLSYHPYANSSNGAVQGSGMRNGLRYVNANPGKGAPYGRGEAWGLDCAVAAYALGTSDWRARKLRWLEQHAELVSTGQIACSGFIQAFVSNKAVNGKYQARQQIEQSITENSLVGLERSVFRGADPTHAQMVRATLADSLHAFISEMAWFPGQFGPWRDTGVGPLDRNQPLWCSRAEMPNDAFSVGDIEAYQDWSSFAYGFELTGDPDFLDFARLQIGASNFQGLAARLRADGTENLVNRAALLALVQKLDGEL